MDSTKFDRSQVADIIKVDGKSYMFPLASFVYPVFVNLDHREGGGRRQIAVDARQNSPPRRRK